ncbi:hypothetical protein EVAR_76316_1 [Eumeta japonica]|uniref:Uncharacterized protein n=1 Tax=Eumeta variegata TaxID=151549 RepID=A0A4C1T7F3_EUMVA|nr:hypothetical protein EVAR_76316_1 [Eumeta japonica]
MNAAEKRVEEHNCLRSIPFAANSEEQSFVEGKPGLTLLVESGSEQDRFRLCRGPCTQSIGLWVPFVKPNDT